MNDKNLIKSLISAFLDRNIIFVPLIDIFKRKISSGLKNKDISDFFQLEMIKVSQKINNHKNQRTEKPLKHPSRKPLISKSKQKFIFIDGIKGKKRYFNDGSGRTGKTITNPR